MLKILLLVVLAVSGMALVTHYNVGPETEQRRDLYLKQLQNDDSVPQQIRADYTRRNTAIFGGVALWLTVATFLYYRDIQNLFSNTTKESA